MARITGAAKVQFKTVDISEIVPGVSTSVGAIVLAARKGDVDSPKLVSSKADFVDKYGKPRPTDLGHHAAIGFLETGRQLYVQRVHLSSLYGGLEVKKSGSPLSATAFSSGEASPTAHVFGVDGIFTVYAANPGAWSDDISIIVSDVDTSEYTFKIKVYVDDENNVPQLEETWLVSRKNKIDGFGNQMYLETKINGYSSYIKVEDNLAEGDTVLPKVVSTAVFMDGGDDGSTVTPGQVVLGWDKFSNNYNVAVNLLICGGQTDLSVLNKMISVAETRQDCFAILDMPLDQTATGADTQVSWVASTFNANTSYAGIYSPWIKIFDEFNGQLVTIPPSGDISAVYVKTDFIYGASHGAPAGYNRGILTRALGLSNTEPYDSGELDTLQDGKINPITRDPGFGVVVFGEDTLQTKASALKNIHVRRLLNMIQSATTSFSRQYLFEPLLERTYFRVRTALEEYMADLEGLGAFDNVEDRGWRVVCDSSNNTPSDRDNNIMNVWIFIKPVKVAKYIVIKAIITRSSANFDAVIAAGVV